MPATYVTGSVREAVLSGDGALTVDLSAAAEGQTRVLIANMTKQATNFSSLSGWTNRINAAHPAGGNTGRLGVWTKVAGTGGESAGSVTIPDDGTITRAVLMSFVVDGTYKRHESTASSDWTVSHVCPAATLDTGDDLAILIAGAAQYQRTWTWPAGTTEIEETTSTGSPDVSIAYRAVSGASTSTTTATADTVEQSHAVTMVFTAPASTGTADIAGSADTVAISSVSITGGAIIAAASETVQRTVTVLGTGGVPIEGAVVSLALTMPSGSATTGTVPATGIAGTATIEVTGGTATTSGQDGSLVASIAGVSSSAVAVTVTSALGARSVRVSDIATAMVGGGATPTTGWYAWVFALPANVDELLGAQLFKASGITLVTDGAGGYKAEFGVPASVSVSASDPVRVILRRAQSVSAASPTEETGVVTGVVL